MKYSAIKKEERTERDRLREMEYFQGCYSSRLAALQHLIAAECDKLEESEGPMYDEYPDRVVLWRICRRICQRISYHCDVEDLVEILLLNEIQKRRCIKNL